MSLLSCSGGIRGTLTNLGKSLSLYRLSNGASGMLNLGTSSTSANPLSPATSKTGKSTSGVITAQTALNGPTQTPTLAVPPTGSIYYLVNETVNIVADTAAAMNGKLGGVTAVQPVLDTPLTPVMTNVATGGIAVPAR